MPFSLILYNKLVSNILLLDVLGTYRGWRHLKGYPVRGQRTWSNGWSVYRSNLVLRETRLKIAKDIYNIHSVNDLNIILLAEQINLMWKLQWNYEWVQAKKRRLDTIGEKLESFGSRRRKKGLFKVDLLGLSQLNFENISKRKKANMRKRTYNKNYISLGFDPGFTRTLLVGSKNAKKTTNVATSVIFKNTVEAKVKKNKKARAIKAKVKKK